MSRDLCAKLGYLYLGYSSLLIIKEGVFSPKYSKRFYYVDNEVFLLVLLLLWVNVYYEFLLSSDNSNVDFLTNVTLSICLLA